MIGLSTRGSISLGWALVAGRKRVPNPAAGKTALRTRMVIERSRASKMQEFYPKQSAFHCNPEVARDPDCPMHLGSGTFERLRILVVVGIPHLRSLRVRDFRKRQLLPTRPANRLPSSA